MNARLNEIIQRIEKARIAYSRSHIVKLVAVSKSVGADEILKAYECGQRAFGENRVPDFVEKSQILQDLPIEWHFIGTLQKNKINALIKNPPTLLHSLDSLDLSIALQSRLEREGKKMRALLEVNSALEDSKSGIHPSEAISTYHDIEQKCPNIILEGIMSIGANTKDHSKIERSFRTSRDIFDKIEGAKTLSMGMSDDFEIAIACGSNMLRIGSLLFR